jgi:putative copper export protein/nitrogen fixation protein FixH
VQHRFEQRFSLPTLLILLLANVGVLFGQALNFTGGQWGASFAPTLLMNLATSGRFGIFWMMREMVIGAAIVLALWAVSSAPILRRSNIMNSVLPWANLILGLVLFIAIAMSSHAAAVNTRTALAPVRPPDAQQGLVFYAVPIDWLHLLAAALWVGGMMYIATTYLPVIRRSAIKEQAHSLITVLPYYTPWAIGAVIAMAITGPFSATFHLTSWAQFITTAYGRALAVKILLVGALLITSAIHVSLLRPRVKKEYQKYAYAAECLTNGQTMPDIDSATGPHNPPDCVRRGSPLHQQVKLREGRLSKKTRRLTNVLRWEPLLGVGVLVCVGLMNVFSGTVSPTAAQQPTAANVKPFNTKVKTTDNKFTVTLNVNPNHFGTNIFTVSVVDNSAGKPTANVGVSLYTTMLDMDMGTDTVNLLPDGKGHFTASGDLSMGGNWQVRIQIRTPKGTLSEANVKFFVPI